MFKSIKEFLHLISGQDGLESIRKQFQEESQDLTDQDEEEPENPVSRQDSTYRSHPASHPSYGGASVAVFGGGGCDGGGGVC